MADPDAPATPASTEALAQDLLRLAAGGSAAQPEQPEPAPEPPAAAAGAAAEPDSAELDGFAAPAAPEVALTPDEIAQRYHPVFEQLYAPYPIAKAKGISRKEREENAYQSTTLVYGEISFLPFAKFFNRLKTQFQALLQPGGVFIDIGCGTGKPVFAAALLHDFERVVGYEILSGLYGAALQVKRTWERDVKQDLPPLKQLTEIEFELGDATRKDWSDATVVFANSTCFSEDLMQALADKASTLQQGAFFITTTKKLPSPHFRVVHTGKMDETWGRATVFIQRKKFDAAAAKAEADNDAAVKAAAAAQVAAAEDAAAQVAAGEAAAGAAAAAAAPPQ